MAVPVPSTMYESFSPFLQLPFYQQISTYQPDTTVTVRISDSRKRFRDSTTESNALHLPQKIKLSNQSKILDQDILLLYNSQQSELNCLIEQHVILLSLSLFFYSQKLFIGSYNLQQTTSLLLIYFFLILNNRRRI